MSMAVGSKIKHFSAILFVSNRSRYWIITAI